MLYRDITSRILEACFEVANELGAGFVESVYQKALLIALQEKGLKVGAQVSLKVMFRDQCVGEFVADLLVEDKIVVELKAVKALAPEHQAQTINYLKATGLDVALLVNFGRPKLEYKRLHRRP
ncbi:MAG: GxxExxY protein [Planctomycetota bacterium]|jgi:GxxExxY protein